ncbi:MAG: hypothetical protein IJ565_02565 [Bacilli bacterium]|nr:hypothetical protein [Bacilli bacterium]
MQKYDYEILNYWNDNDDLYVDYVVTNKETDEQAHACTLLNTDMIEDYISKSNIDDELISIISKSDGNEFNLPKTSELHKITYDIFKELCDSDNNMLWVEEYDDFERLNLNDNTYKLLYEDINKYHLNDYFEQTGKTLTVYGGLQCCFNDDLARGDNYER